MPTVKTNGIIFDAVKGFIKKGTILQPYLDVAAVFWFILKN